MKDFVAAPVIVDEFPPFAWTGAGAPLRWGHDEQVMMATQKLSAFHGALGTATTWTRDGQRAYLVVPVTFTFGANGSPMRETGLWAFTLRRVAGAWKIATASWATRAITTAS